MTQPETPTLEKMKRVHDRSQAIGEFLSWLLNSQAYLLCRWVENKNTLSGGELRPIDGGQHGIVKFLLSEYFDIDLDAAERERQALLDAVRLAAEEREKGG